MYMAACLHTIKSPWSSNGRILLPCKSERLKNQDKFYLLLTMHVWFETNN